MHEKQNYIIITLEYKRSLSVLLFTQCCENTATYVWWGAGRGAVTPEMDVFWVELVAKNTYIHPASRSPLPGASLCAVPLSQPLSQPFPVKNYF